MVVCSCNVLTDGMIKNFLQSVENGCKARDVYCGLGCSERCGQCAQTIKEMIASHGLQNGRELAGALHHQLELEVAG